MTTHTIANLEGVNGAVYYVAEDTEGALAIRKTFREATNVGRCSYVSVYDANGDRIMTLGRTTDPESWLEILARVG